jgi:excisionase family DNA binding protein
VLTVNEAAERAAVSPSLVYQWIAEGTLPCFRLGGKGKRGTIRIMVEDLDQVMSSFRVRPVSVPAFSRSPASPFSELDSSRLSRARSRKPR